MASDEMTWCGEAIPVVNKVSNHGISSRVGEMFRAGLSPSDIAADLDCHVDSITTILDFHSNGLWRLVQEQRDKANAASDAAEFPAQALKFGTGGILSAVGR
jgi:hypothetical protein